MRYLIATTVALGVTLLLFLLMHTLISGEEELDATRFGGSLLEFIHECQHQGMRCIQIIHGKGYRSQSGRAVLKPHVAYWLKRMDEVLAFCPAQPKDGGNGALYVLLKAQRGGR